MLNHVRKNSFSKGDRIYIDNVYSTNTKHAGQTATVISVGFYGKLTVKFDDPKHKGRFVDPRDAVIITTPNAVQSTTDKSVDDLGDMLNHLAISTGYAIKNYAVDDQKIVLRKFIKVVQDTIE